MYACIPARYNFSSHSAYHWLPMFKFSREIFPTTKTVHAAHWTATCSIHHFIWLICGCCSVCVVNGYAFVNSYKAIITFRLHNFLIQSLPGHFLRRAKGAEPQTTHTTHTHTSSPSFIKYLRFSNRAVCSFLLRIKSNTSKCPNLPGDTNERCM